MKQKKILVTGAAGFIGFHVAKELLEKYVVVGLDIVNDYYDINLKYDRLRELGIDKRDITKESKIISHKYPSFSFIKADLANHDFIVDFMVLEKFDYVVNLAAQAGVRYSLENPKAYTKSNIDGFLSILEGSRKSKVKHLIYASTSSVYGLNSKMPLVENMPTEHPMTIYAATKKANEMMAHSYSHLFDIPTTGLRFFTVYGPWGRPDMALFLFTKAILEGSPVNLFNHGKMIRDFTYVSDIAQSIFRLIEKSPLKNEQWDTENPQIDNSSAPYKIFNIGNGNPVQLLDYIKEIEVALGKKAKYNFMEMQLGDVKATHANTNSLQIHVDFKPNTSIKSGIENFINWYLNYYQCAE
ncbi:MAG: NAD-dependent epimerase/dehydratase family protein [Flavobacteriaceae bacterium]